MYGDNYSRTSGIWWRYYRDVPNDISTNSKLLKMKITRRTPADDNRKDVKVVVSLKYLTNFRRNLEISLINCEINFI